MHLILYEVPLTFYRIPIWLGGAAVVTIFVLSTLTGIEVVYKFHPVEFRRRYNDIVGFIIAVVGVLYAILLSSIAIMAMGNYNKAESYALKEAGLLENIHLVSRSLPSGTGGMVRRAAVEYANAVIDKEWPAMQDGQIPTAGWPKLKELEDIAVNIHPATIEQQKVQMQMMTEISGLANARRARIFLSRHGIQVETWCVIILGTMGTINFTFFFGLDKRWHQMLSGSLAALAALVVFLIAALDHPYMGQVHVSSAVIRQAVSRMESK